MVLAREDTPMDRRREGKVLQVNLLILFGLLSIIG